MTREGDGHEPPDEFAHLFRPEESHPSDDPHPADGAAAVEVGRAAGPFDDWEPLVAVPTATPLGGARFEDPPLPAPAGVADDVDPMDEPFIEPERAVDAEVAHEVAPPVATPDSRDGRLFRSRGAPERADAIVAIGSMQARRLRTMTRGDEPAEPIMPVLEEVVVRDEAALPILPVASSGEPAPALQVMAISSASGPAPAAESVERSRRAVRRESTSDRDRSGSGSLTGLGVYAVTIGVTLILGFGETLLFGGEPGIITGIGLLVVSVFAAFTVRTYDGIHAVFAPSIAFLVVSLTAGQIGVTAAGITGRAVVVFFLLGNNWIWILGSTAAALVIVALRRRVG